MSLLHETLTHEDIDLLWRLRQNHPWASTRELKRLLHETKTIAAQVDDTSEVHHDG